MNQKVVARQKRAYDRLVEAIDSQKLDSAQRHVWKSKDGEQKARKSLTNILRKHPEFAQK